MTLTVNELGNFKGLSLIAKMKDGEKENTGMRKCDREQDIKRNVTLSYCLRQSQTLLQYTSKILHINGSQASHFKFLYKEKYSQIFEK